MIQKFDILGGKDYGRKNLPALRKKLKKLKLDGFLIPHEDEYNNEYLPECNERLMWVSGFTGSAGAAVVLLDKAGLFVDGRYTLQVREQADADLFEFHGFDNGDYENWLKQNCQNKIIGYDPRLHSPRTLAIIKQNIEAGGGKMRALGKNPIDSAWHDRPPAPKAKISIQALKYAGLSHAEKRKTIAKIIKEKNADAVIITDPASIAWLLNIRGGDVPCTPLPLASLVLHKNAQADLFIDMDKLSPKIKKHLGNNIKTMPEEQFAKSFSRFAQKNIMLDPETASCFVFDRLKRAKANIIHAQNPIALPKACKNKAEIMGSINAHIRDGAAVCNFLHWLDENAPAPDIDEIKAAERLENFRHDTGKLKDLSFETISGSGPNGAIVHYRVNIKTNRRLKSGELFLLDSGGQYKDGTTDITRTIPIGKPTKQMIRAFTLVLKGHIALATIRFPQGTSGHQLDVLARSALWKQGFDYDHGTGHGVGVYLGVHEGPQRISKMPNNIALKPGMIVSNEPGYYKTGKFGIRIENLQYVTKAEAIKGGDRKMLGFETLTLAPIDNRLIDKSLLSPDEVSWINSYHKRVFKTLSPLVDKKTKPWLKQMCQNI